MKHHGGGPLFRRKILNRLVVQQDLSPVDLQKASQGSENRGFAAAAGAEHGDEFSFMYLNVDVFHPVSVGVDFLHVLDFQLDFLFYR